MAVFGASLQGCPGLFFTILQGIWKHIWWPLLVLSHRAILKSISLDFYKLVWKILCWKLEALYCAISLDFSGLFNLEFLAGYIVFSLQGSSS